MANDGTQLQRASGVSVCRHHVHRDVAGLGVLLEPLQHRQAGPSVSSCQQDGVGQELAGQRKAVARAVRNQAAVLKLMREVVEDAGKGRVVLDRENQAPPSALCRSSGKTGNGHGRIAGRAEGAGARCALARRGLHVSEGTLLRQHEREGAAFTLCALDAMLPPSSAEIAEMDRAQAGAA